jgi:hypothetical protein
VAPVPQLNATLAPTGELPSRLLRSFSYHARTSPTARCSYLIPGFPGGPLSNAVLQVYVLELATGGVWPLIRKGQAWLGIRGWIRPAWRSRSPLPERTASGLLQDRGRGNRTR